MKTPRVTVTLSKEQQSELSDKLATLGIGSLGNLLRMLLTGDPQMVSRIAQAFVKPPQVHSQDVPLSSSFTRGTD